MSARYTARRIAEVGLRGIPLGWLQPLRRAYASGTPGRRRLLKPVIDVVRHRPLTVPDFALPDNPAVRLCAAENLMVRRLYWFGEEGWEPGEAGRWRELCASARCVLEVGANVGYYTVQGARAMDGTYIAVEPNPESAAILRRNLALNALDRVQVVEAAVMPEAGRVTLNFPDSELYAATTGAYVTGASVTRVAMGSVEVEGVAMRDLLTPEVDLVKMDIEGMEEDVLRSVWDLLLSQRPRIVIEVRRSATSLQALVDELCAAGYAAEPLADRDLLLTWA